MNPDYAHWYGWAQLNLDLEKIKFENSTLRRIAALENAKNAKPTPGFEAALAFSGISLFNPGPEEKIKENMNDIELESEDLQVALEELHQYVDVTEEDLKKIYKFALRHAKERLTLKVPVRDVMTTNVICINKDASVHEAARILSENRISGMPVVDEEKHLIGIVTEADILYSAGMKKSHDFRDILRHVLGEPHPKIRNGSKVKEIMTTQVITTSPERDIGEVARILDEKRIKRLPVVDENNKLIGIISRANIVRYLGKQ